MRCTVYYTIVEEFFCPLGHTFAIVVAHFLELLLVCQPTSWLMGDHPWGARCCDNLCTGRLPGINHWPKEKKIQKWNEIALNIADNIEVNKIPTSIGVLASMTHWVNNYNKLSIKHHTLVSNKEKCMEATMCRVAIDDRADFHSHPPLFFGVLNDGDGGTHCV